MLVSTLIWKQLTQNKNYSFNVILINTLLNMIKDMNEFDTKTKVNSHKTLLNAIFVLQF